jgi:hypothetical protein
VVTCSSCNVKNGREGGLQLEEGEVGVAVVRLALALLHDIVLEDVGCLRVVPVEAVEDLLDVLRPVRRKVVGGCSHGGCGRAAVRWCVCWRLCQFRDSAGNEEAALAEPHLRPTITFLRASASTPQISKQ